MKYDTEYLENESIKDIFAKLRISFQQCIHIKMCFGVVVTDFDRAGHIFYICQVAGFDRLCSHQLVI